MSTTSQSSPNRTSGTDDNNAKMVNDVEPKGTKQQMNEAETPSPISPGKYNINWDEIDESFNPFGSKAGPLKIKSPATKLIQKMTVASNSNQDADAQAEQKANIDQSNHVIKENKPEEALEYSSPNEGVPPYNTQTSKPLPDIFADKPLGATAKWDQVDWDAVDQLDDHSKIGSGAGAKLGKKSTGGKLAPTTKKKEAAPGGARMEVQPDKPADASINETAAHVAVSDTPGSRPKSKLAGGKSGTKDPEEKTGEPANNTEPQSSSPISPGKYNINWDEIDESFNPFGSKAGPLKTKPSATNPTPKVAAVSNPNPDAVAETGEKTITEKPAAVSEEKEAERNVESTSPQDEPPPLNTQKSNPLPDIFADKPLGATAKWDQVDWDAVDQLDDHSKTGTGAVAKLSKKSTGAKLAPTTRKKEADKDVSDRSQSGVKAESVDGKSEIKVVNTNSNNEQSTTREEPVHATVTETDSPTSPGKYNINWDEIDESFNPFGPKAGPLKTKPPLAKPHSKATAALKADKAKIVRNSKDPNKLPSSSQDAPMDHQPLTSQEAYDWDELGPSSDPFGKSGPKLPPKSPNKVPSKGNGPNDDFCSNQSHSPVKLPSKSNASPSASSTNPQKQPMPLHESCLPNGNGVPRDSAGTAADHNGIPQTTSSSNPGAPPSPSELAEVSFFFRFPMVLVYVYLLDRIHHSFAVVLDWWTVCAFS
ncbi:hypothetical protein P879_00260 [Paragonimus westermani]|uniref:Uncharacterized protein n=1 Tax=Paragonimus westermani TaxID=34504 RepID=A0A8T0DSF0_9TREM|nr:hypothetical protein P879_00260 [Paragonimus westermani]